MIIELLLLSGLLILFVPLISGGLELHARWCSRRRSRGAEEAAEIAQAYVATGPILTAAERAFYNVLIEIAGAEFVVLAKVRLADVVRPRRGDAPRDWARAFRRLAEQHVDFVLCRATDMVVLCAIELDASGASSPLALARRAEMASVFKVAELPLLHFQPQPAYRLQSVAEAIAQALHVDMTALPVEQRAMANG